MKKKTTTQTNPMEALLQKKSFATVKKGMDIEATIISLSRKNVLFDIGAKAYALLGNQELREISTYLPYLKEGQTAHVRIIAEESKDGYPVVSMRKFFEKGKWDILKDKKEKEEEIEEPKKTTKKKSNGKN